MLAIDTSLGTALALCAADEAVAAQASSPNPLGHAEVIGDLLQQVVAGNEDITAVAAGMGPGPFTGLRIGIATARTFALARGIEVVAVPSHHALALSALPTTQGRFAIVTDARRREVAITVYEGQDADGIPAVVADTVLVPRVDMDAHLDGTPAVEATELDAAALAVVALRAVAAGRSFGIDEPLYLRQPDVTMPGAPKKVGL